MAPVLAKGWGHWFLWGESAGEKPSAGQIG